MVVVRLKGGDPFLFGRGGEEAGWLAEHGIAWEVVPGVTSAVAVPAYAGIPVTHRMVNGSLHVVTGHEGESADGVEIDWGVLARSQGTIVVLMGVKNLETIAENLMAEGLSGKTPVAMIRWGTLAEQETLVTELERAAADVDAAGIKPPAVCVIGNVVRLRETLAWVEKRPLFGLRVAVTRPVDENSVLAGALMELGAEVADVPTLKVQALPAFPMAGTMKRLATGEFDWLCFTSANGVRQFARALAECGYDMRSLARCRVAAIGSRTAVALREAGVAADLVSQDATQEGLAAALKLAGAQRVLVARAKVARPVLEDDLKNHGTAVDVLPVYETVPDPDGIERFQHLLERRKLQVVTFTSARTFDALAEVAGAMLSDLLSGAAVAVIGPITRAAVEKAGIRVDIEAPQADMAALVEAIAQWRGTNISAPRG
jgi:uroporphyrinogen III methyltransferase/synthase